MPYTNRGSIGIDGETKRKIERAFKDRYNYSWDQTIRKLYNYMVMYKKLMAERSDT